MQLILSSFSHIDLQLSGSMVASSFGKLVMKEDPRGGIKVRSYVIHVAFILIYRLVTAIFSHMITCLLVFKTKSCNICNIGGRFGNCFVDDDNKQFRPNCLFKCKITWMYQDILRG